MVHNTIKEGVKTLVGLCLHKIGCHNINIILKINTHAFAIKNFSGILASRKIY